MFRLSGTIFLIVGVGLLVSCETPKMPSVDAKLTVPLSNEYYDILRLKKDLEKNNDSLELQIVSDSVLLNINHDEHVQIGDHLDADPSIDTTDGVINGDLRLNDSATTTFSLGYLAPITVDTLNGRLPSRIIPAFNVPLSSKSATFNNFTTMTAFSGSELRTTVTNNTQANFDSLTIVVIDQSNNARMDSFKTNVTVGGNQIITKTFSLTTVVHSPFLVRVYGHSTGSGSSVLVDTSRSLSIKVVTDFSGSSITGKFPAQTIVRTDSFKSSSNSVIDSGYVQSGKITLNFTNLGMPVNGWLFFSSSDFDSAGIKLFRRIRILTGGTPSAVIKLDNWRVVPSASTIGNQYLNYGYIIRTDSSVNNGTTIADNQGVRVRTTLDTMKFSRIRAKLAQEDVDLNRSSQSLDIKHLDSIQIRRALFEIITDHRVPFPMTLDITITGKRLPNLIKTVHVISPIPAYTTGLSQRDTIRTYTNVAALLGILPDSVIVSGKVTVGNNVVSGVVNREDFVNTQVNLRAPLIFSLPNDPKRNITKTTPSEVAISDQQKQKLYDRLKSVMIKGRIINHFPVPISVQFIIDSSSSGEPTEIRFYDSSSVVRFVYPSAPFVINKGVTDAGGIVTASSDTTISYLLDQSEYQKIFDPNITIYRGLRIQLLGTGGYIQVSSDDFIDVKTNVEFEYFIDEHF